MKKDFESVGEVIEVLVTMRQVEGRGGVVLTDMVAEDWRKEEVSLLWLAKSSIMAWNETHSSSMAKEGKTGISPLN